MRKYIQFRIDYNAELTNKTYQQVEESIVNKVFIAFNTIFTRPRFSTGDPVVETLLNNP